MTGNPELEDFFTEEYSLNHLIHTYPKPYIAFMDGIVMGGGMGISQGASLRIVTERSKLAMPETLIGLFPDVGGGYFLSRCAGRLGEYLALTGARDLSTIETAPVITPPHSRSTIIGIVCAASTCPRAAAESVMSSTANASGRERTVGAPPAAGATAG